MEAYTLDPLLRRQEVIDQFESLIWTERYQAYGDFEMDIFSNSRSRTLLKTGTKLAMNESHRIMTVETVEDSHDSEGRKMLKVKGRSIESILEDRIAKESLSDLTTSPKWTITDTPANVARKIFHDICVLGILDPMDVIPFINEGTFMPEDTIAEPVDPITVELDPTTVYNALTEICSVWNLGFRMLRYYDTSQLYFDVYTGSDRTTSQTLLAPVVFTHELDNLQNIKKLTTIEKAKNVAYVYSPAGFQKVYPVGVEPDVNGFERRILVVNATDITADNPNVESALLQRGREELAKNQAIQSLDGEINQFSQYKYGTHYNLGDIVEMRNDDGETNNMRVTEQIFVSDREGERTYPTLTVNTFITTGSWLSWMNNKVWQDLADDPTTWSEQP
ncbi:minor tail protein [Streptomyces phage Maya]|nr:minor tail protein [Streptomyces phage Spectropatronm]QAY16323.1 minor tail protein [Streptomyces phage Namo]QEQ93718.1 minor tail protein [Streptomyces phage Jaylociraptor]QEQ93973.1 minor tail protein [Streptomyces phage Meibysrarus]QEQ94242.1 minor tail protein [Streptomyces phage Hoshi]QGJ96724.1 minor tail protein [Streptomyces phage FidgetOrca]QNN98190.1 minor tail protein [Streptomyces phage Maya]QPX62052.1 minor tail protein [Streptomyces phage Indigenous]